MRIIRALRRTWHLVRVNWKSLVTFELFYKAGVAVAFTLLFSLGLRLILRVMGFSYVTRENVGALLVHPLTILLILLLILLTMICAMIDIGAVVYILDRSAQRVRCRMVHILRFSVRNALRVWRPANLPLAAVLVLFSPFMSLGMACGLMAALSPPDFLRDSLRLSPLPYALGLALVVLLRWEIAVALHPERFDERTNASLRCANCTDKLCYLRAPLRKEGRGTRNTESD